MLFKLIFLFAALTLHGVKMNPYPPALLYTIPLVLMSLLSGSSFFMSLIWGAITLCVSFVYFSLLTHVSSGPRHYAIIILGGMLLIFFV
ncbi:hypothetical protein A6E05_00710 [Aliivibrio sp. 1S165]|jgi:hypothetical protein|uniref:hypothetical protein n=1 Tax=unclassified Aliivibrio TaxID=2645654 RepID=UPI00080EDDC7|nr:MULTISPECIES: hypothetical protein [unclassified Aliivibrio]OCH18904.1 hypothetical protein A6E05_00710 [Aliivibrio sp. 1S165]OCH30902.1 hypothetical protein A6E06_04795 [Aliivibrio sp. 1S175]